MANVPFTCRCGQVKGTLCNVTPTSGNHVRCYCASCRAAFIYTGAADPGTAGVTLFQTTPDHVSFEKGQDLLAVFSFGPRNILRWQAGCCKAALFTTLRTPKLPLAALVMERVTDPALLGPVRSQAFVPQPGGKTRHENKVVLIGGTLWRALVARLTGKWKNTPFFDITTGKPVAKVMLVSRQERQAILPEG